MEKKKSNFADKIARNTKKQKNSSKGFGYLNLPKDMPLLRLPEDTREVELDFLPYIVGEGFHPDRDAEFDIAMPGTEWYRRPISVHTRIGINNESCICLKSFGKKCPICDYQKELFDKKTEEDKKLAIALYPKPRSIYVVIPYGLKKFEEAPSIWDMSDFLFQDILNEELESDPENRSFPDLEFGKTLILKLRWKEIGKNTFPEVRNIIFEDRKPFKDTILDEIPDLDKILKVYSYEALQAKLFEIEEEDAGKLEKDDNEDRSERRHRRDDDETDKKPSRSRRETDEEEKPSRSRRTEDEKEERPARSRKTDEDERPARSRRKDDEPEKSVKEKEEPLARSRSRKEKEEFECPSKYKFGEDFEKFKECEDCSLWNDCYNEYKTLK